MAKMMEEFREGTDKVDARKRINKMLWTVRRRNAKPTVCALCGKTVRQVSDKSHLGSTNGPEANC